MTSKWIFVAGTGTDVGKTYCASEFAETRHRNGEHVGVYKPVASGCDRDGQGVLVAADAVQLWRAAGQPLSLELVCPQRFEASLAPPEAAVAEGKRVDENQLIDGLGSWQAFDVVLIEGAGGLFSPISDNLLNIDFALKLQEIQTIEVVLIAANRLGVQHDVIACVRAAKQAGLAISEVVLNSICPDQSSKTNAMRLSAWLDVPVRDFEPHH